MQTTADAPAPAVLGDDDVSALASLIGRRLRCASHRDSIGPAARTPRTGRYLERLVSDPRRFENEVWDRSVLLTKADCGHLFSGTDLTQLLRYGGLRLPEIRLVHNRESVPIERYARDLPLGNHMAADVVDPGRVTRLVNAGATLVLQGLRRFWEPVDTFCAGLEGDLGAPVQATVFFTPANGSGIPKHHDLHGVFVLQLEGARRWTYGSIPERRPEEHVPPESITEASMDNEVVLRPGDSLYIPRGCPHFAHVVPGESSLHLTLSFRDAPTIAEVAGATMAAVAERLIAFDETTPVPSDDGNERLVSRLRECIAHVTSALGGLDRRQLLDIARLATTSTLSTDKINPGA